jgi:hypothetical protein
MGTTCFNIPYSVSGDKPKGPVPAVLAQTTISFNKTLRFYLEHNVSETGFCLPLQVEPTELVPTSVFISNTTEILVSRM